MVSLKILQSENGEHICGENLHGDNLDLTKHQDAYCTHQNPQETHVSGCIHSEVIWDLMKPIQMEVCSL